MPKDFVATFHNEKQAQNWEQILGPGIRTVYVKTPTPTMADVPGFPNTPIYELDLDLLHPDQHLRLVIHLAKRFNIPITQVQDKLEEEIVPIRASDVSITIYNPQKWL